MKSLLRLSRSLFADLRRLHPECKGFDRDLQTIEARVEYEGAGFIAVALPAMGKAFDQGLACGRMPSVRGFSCGSGAIPQFLRGMLSHVFDTKTGFLLKNPSVEYILSIRQVLYFFKKFLPSDRRTSVLHDRTVADFKETDGQCKGTFEFSFADRLSHVARLVLLDLDEFQEIKGRHGPGAVAEGHSSNQKWSELWSGLVDFDPRLLSLGYDMPILGLSPTRGVQSDSNIRGRLSSRLVTVPKSSSALRTITVEPMLNQFVQQGLNWHLRDCIRRCPILKRSLELNSQVPNQLLALQSSLSGDYSTVDLSSASDLLSLQTVELVFSSRRRFLNALLGCRTESVEVDSNPLLLKKYAGMGNGCTFPVQSVVFALLAICAMHRGKCHPTYKEVQSYASNVRVFGDDIIIRTDYIWELGRWMSEFGLKINRAKTFYSGKFRESCGVDAYNGVDVTPCYLRVDPSLTSDVPSSYASLVSSSNQLWLRGYYSASLCLQRMLERKRPLPLVRSDSSGLGWHTRQNVQEFHRWNPLLHRFEVKTYVQIPKRQSDKLDGEPGLLKFFHSPRIAEDDPDHSRTSVRRFSTKLARRWVP